MMGFRQISLLGPRWEDQTDVDPFLPSLEDFKEVEDDDGDDGADIAGIMGALHSVVSAALAVVPTPVDLPKLWAAAEQSGDWSIVRGAHRVTAEAHIPFLLSKLHGRTDGVSAACLLLSLCEDRADEIAEKIGDVGQYAPPARFMAYPLLAMLGGPVAVRSMLAADAKEADPEIRSIAHQWLRHTCLT